MLKGSYLIEFNKELLLYTTRFTSCNLLLLKIFFLLKQLIGYYR